MKKIALFGVTGSIGISTLSVVDAFPEEFSIIAVSAGTNQKLFSSLLHKYSHTLKAGWIHSDHDLDGQFDFPVKQSSELSQEWLLETKPDLVVMALPGSAGWKVTLAALQMDIPVALANKEALLIAGVVMGRKNTQNREKLIPIDSEHAALMQLLHGVDKNDITKVILTASGGAFRDVSAEKMRKATYEEALKHPVWEMGAKVTVDSATMLNKGMELMEAWWLFDVEAAQLGALLHPEVAAHAMVHFKDGSATAQMAVSDMRIPIGAALSYPKMLPLTERLENLSYSAADTTLHFHKPDMNKYPLLNLALELLKESATAGMIAYAISDEVAVDAFSKGRINLGQLVDIVLEVTATFRKEKRLFHTAEDVENFISEVSEKTAMLIAR
ncbi:1-deoxy-D-xylulose-5-phosphate reductoisomerase [bacterium]|nr:1-deoxy-D-xylulose-5-phosphate reductoisomerase [bacterium]